MTTRSKGNDAVNLLNSLDGADLILGHGGDDVMDGVWRLRVGVARALGFIERAEEASDQLARRGALED